MPFHLRPVFLTLLLTLTMLGTLKAQPPKPETVDSFRTLIVDAFNYNEKIYIGDTLQFVQLGLYAFVNYDNTSTFYDLLLCYEPGFKREADPPQSFVTVQQQKMIRDIRWLFLFYLDQYVLRTPQNRNKVSKQSRIALLNIKEDDFIEIYGEKGFDHVIKIYQTLIIAMNKKTFYEQVVRDRKISMMEFIGYRWEVFGS